MPSDPQLCSCGDPLHYVREETRLYVQRTIDELGECVPVSSPSAGAWMVPRHFIALHGLRAVDLPQLAARYGWERPS